MNNLAYTLQQEGHYPAAEKLQRETLSLQSRVLGSEHPDTLRSMNNLANSLVAEGQLAEALELQRQALATKQRVLGPEPARRRSVQRDRDNRPGLDGSVRSC
jgi:hypothetical protein